MIKTAFYLLILVLMLCYNANGQSTKAERIILAKVGALPEVKSFVNIAKDSNPEIMIAKTPEKGFKFYWVQVGLGNLGRFRTNYDLYVDSKTYEIFYLDRFTDPGEQQLTLNQWRKWRKLPVWQKWHCYKYKGKKLTIYACKP